MLSIVFFAKSLKDTCKTKKTELLFVALFLRALKIGGRCASIVPDGVLFGSSSANRDLRKKLVENNRLEAVISMPAGVFSHTLEYLPGLLYSRKQSLVELIKYGSMT